MTARSRGWVVGAAALAAALWLSFGLRATQPPRTGAKGSGTESKLTGTSSCSGRGCHGSLEPMGDDRLQRNEFTTWVMHDKHADAYRVLFNEKSKAIAEKLYGSKRPAHQEERCLACHTVPQVAGNPALWAAQAPAGVGCEACHGPAQNWLSSHTLVDWSKFEGAKRAEKQKELCMTQTADPATLAGVCAGCHIGAPEDKKLGIPLRDMNHDLIAAGHPRLNFEFGAYLANMPHHWRDKKNTLLEDSASVWAIGQLVSARAALELLADRAGRSQAEDPKKRAPWPEFAEYDCFACHHDLHEPSWRQRRVPGQKLGAPPWSDWYFFMPRMLAERGPLKSDKSDAVPVALDALRGAMNRPGVDPGKAGAGAKAAAGALEVWLGPAKGKLDRALLRQELTPFTDEKNLQQLSWDQAAQLYLAAAALVDRDDKGRKERDALVQMLESPTTYDRPTKEFKSREELLKDFRGKLHAVLKPAPP